MHLNQTAHSYLQLGVMLVTNVLLCWYPVYYWTTYPASSDGRDGMVLLPGLFIACLTWVFMLFPIFRIWTASASFTLAGRLKHRIVALGMSCGILSPLWILLSH